MEQFSEYKLLILSDMERKDKAMDELGKELREHINDYTYFKGKLTAYSVVVSGAVAIGVSAITNYIKGSN